MTRIQDAYSTRELAALLSFTRQNIDYRARTEGWDSRPRAGQGGGRVWVLASMPDATRLLVASALASRLAVNVPAPARATSSGKGGSCCLPLAKRTRAEARALAVRMARDFAVVYAGSKTDAFTVFAARYNGGEAEAPAWMREALPRLCRQSLDNWDKAVRREGVAALAGKHGKHRKGSGAIDAQEEVKEFCLAHIYEFPQAGAGHIHNGLKARFGKREDVILPSQRTVQLWYRAWLHENKELYTFLCDPDAWRSHNMLALGNADSLITRVNQRWEMDSTVADLMLADGKRYTIVACIDVYTRRVVFLVSRTSSAHAVASCLRKALLLWGVPEEIATDNGSDYVSNHIQSLILSLNIHQHICPPFSPEKKPFVESVFRTFLHAHVEVMQGFVGHSVADRKKLEARKSFAERMFKKDVVVESRLTAAELQAMCDTWTHNSYMHRPHSGLKGVSPFARAHAWNGAIARIENERALDMLLLPCPGGDGMREVSKKGIRLNGVKYIDDALGLYSRQRVQVRIDDADIGRIYLFHAVTGEYLCTARNAELAGLSQADVKAIATNAKRIQRTQRTSGAQALREAAKAAQVKDIARERLTAEAEAAAAIVAATPARTYEFETHTSAALEGAAVAARAGQVPAPAPVSEREAAAQADVLRVLTLETVVTATGETPEARYWRAYGIEQTLRDIENGSGHSFPPDSIAWFERYRKTPEYDSQRRMHQIFGDSHYLKAAAQ